MNHLSINALPCMNEDIYGTKQKRGDPTIRPGAPWEGARWKMQGQGPGVWKIQGLVESMGSGGTQGLSGKHRV